MISNRKKNKILTKEIEIKFVYLIKRPKNNSEKENDCRCVCHQKWDFEDEKYPISFLESKSNYFKGKKTLFYLKCEEVHNILSKYTQTKNYAIENYSKLIKTEIIKKFNPKILINFFNENFDEEIIDPKSEEYSELVNNLLGNIPPKKTNWTVEEDKMLRFLIIKHYELGWGKIALIMNKKTIKEIKMRWEKCIVPCIKIEGWTERQKWFFYLFKRNMGPNWKEINRIFHFKTINQLIYLWNKEIVKKRSEYENLIYNLFKNKEILFSNDLSPLEIFLIRKYLPVENKGLKFDGLYLRKRKRTTWVPQTLENLFSPKLKDLDEFKIYESDDKINSDNEFDSDTLNELNENYEKIGKLNFKINFEKIRAIIFSSEEVNIVKLMKKIAGITIN